MAERQALGIDVDEYSRTGGINYRLFKQHVYAGVADFMIIKAGLGERRSTIFNEQRQNADLYGIPYLTYHFLDPRRDMRAQAQKYVEWVGTDQPAYIVDVESPAGGVELPGKQQLLTYINELESLTHKQPVIYTSTGILRQIDFMEEARQFRLWIAQYLYDQEQLPQVKAQYRYFDEFTRDYSNSLPPSVANTPLSGKVVLWQFSAKGDGRHYIYSALTESPSYPTGKKSADLNISIQGRDEFLQELFGGVLAIEISVHVNGGSPVESTYPDIDNQDMINLIFVAATPFTHDPWRDWIVRARLEYLGVPTSNRLKPYTGPRIENLPNLTQVEKAAILDLIETVNHEVISEPRPYPGITNQQMINLIYRAALPFTDDPWVDWIMHAHLENLAIPNENRGKPYTGPKIEELPNLTAEQKAAILSLLQ